MSCVTLQWLNAAYSRTIRGGGKTQPVTTTYSYSASFAVALSARPIAGVGRIWADGKLLRGAAGDWKSDVSAFRLHLGGEDQAADPLIASARPDTPAHRGIAYAVFERLQLADYGNRIPSLTFEVVAEMGPVMVGDVAAAIGAGAIVGDGPAARIDGFAASGDSAAGALEVLAGAAGAWFVPEGGRMRMADAASGAVALPGDARVARTRRPAETVPVMLSVSHYDPAREWLIGVQQARRPGAGWREEAVELPAALSAGGAAGTAEAMLLTREAARESVQVVTDTRAIGIAPGAAVTLPGEDAVWRVARASVEDAGVTLDLTPLPTGAPVRPADPGAAVPAPDVAMGETLLVAAELPPLSDALPNVPQVTVLAAGTAPGWRAAGLMLSGDGGASWEEIGGTAAPATLGVLATPLTAGPATLRHDVSVEVVLAHDAMTLEAADAAALDRGANLALVGEELIQFRDAVQIAARRWRLSALLRGKRGTASRAQAAGTRFALLERDTVLIVPAPVLRGGAVRVLARGVGDGEGGVEVAVPFGAASVAPPSPVHLRVENGVVRWTRRSRLGWDWRDGADAPLAEEAERYRVEIAEVSRTRSVVVDAPAWAIDAAGPLTVTVRQIGTLAESAPVAIIV